ncbi:MAG: DUF6340 family protein [Bacteroidales bacterium]
MRILKIGKWGFISLLLSLLLLSCAPIATLLSIEERVEPEFPIDFSTQSAALFIIPDIALPNQDWSVVNDSLLMLELAEGVAKGIEERGELNSGDIFIFSNRGRESEWKAETIREFSLLSNSDIILLVDSLSIELPSIENAKRVYREDGSSALYPQSKIRSLIHLYDGFSGERVYSIPKCDTTYWESDSFTQYRSAPFLERFQRLLPSLLNRVGENLSERLFPSWRTIERTIYIFNSSPWIEAYDAASKLQFDQALNFWIEESGGRDLSKIAAAANNIAVICELKGEYSLALEWLELSIKSASLPSTHSYYNYIKERVESQ